MAFDRQLSAAEELAFKIQLHRNYIETSSLADFADSVSGSLEKAAELIGSEEITLGDTVEETQRALEGADIENAGHVAKTIHQIAEGRESFCLPLG